MRFNLFSPCWRYLLRGSDELYLPSSWLRDKARLGNYVGYTRRQLEQGSVTKNSQWFKDQAFWQAVEAKRGPKVLRYPRQA